MNKIIIPFGCPRSGTTYLDQMMRTIEGVTVLSLRESFPNHPCQHRMGLVGLARLMREQHLVFVRIKRHPMDIVRSFYAVRDSEMPGTIGRKTDDQIIEYIQKESYNFHRQMKWVANVKEKAENNLINEAGPGWNAIPWRVVEVEYSGLWYREGADHFCGTLFGALEVIDVSGWRKLIQNIRNTFNVKEHAVNCGRLKNGVATAMTVEQYNYFKSKLRTVIEKEGYAE